MAGGMPLAFTQEDFLVLFIFVACVIEKNIPLGLRLWGKCTFQSHTTHVNKMTTPLPFLEQLILLCTINFLLKVKNQRTNKELSSRYIQLTVTSYWFQLNTSPK